MQRPGAALVRNAIPLRVRMGMATWFAKNRWFPGGNRWAEGLIRDLEDRDLKAFHKFLWEHHLDRYGEAYQAEDLFASGKLNSTTHAFDAFVEDLEKAANHVGGLGAIASVLDAGCSVGHVLWSLEQGLFAHAEDLVGVDIDRPAIGSGAAYLAEQGSRIRLHVGDLEGLGEVLGDQRFDFTYAAGSLSYLEEPDAQSAVAALLGRTDRLAGFIGLANPGQPNSDLDGSVFREDWGRMWTHNFEKLVAAAGWDVIVSRWDPPSEGDAQGLYLVFAVPGGV